jgi:hypothetical protein
LPVTLLEVSTPLSQKLADPFGLIVGVAGVGLTVTLVAADGALVQLPSVTVTV